MKGNSVSLLNSVLVTEKTTVLNEKNQSVAFLVSPDMGKVEIKQIINRVFPKLQIRKVRSMNLVPKVKRFKGKQGVRVKRKKILVSFYGSHDLRLVD